MTDIDIPKLRELLAKATPGPWHIDHLGKVRCEADDGKGFIADPGDGRYYNSIPRDTIAALSNAALIAAARNDLLTMLDEIARLRSDRAKDAAEIKQLTGLLEEYRTEWKPYDPVDRATVRAEAMEEAAKVIDGHYWDSTGEVGKAHGNSLAKMIRDLAQQAREPGEDRG